jgi:hypothetical protein
MELCPPFDGWTLDQDGTIRTPCGYRCTPRQIESALWLMGMAREFHGGRLMYADDAPGARRAVYDMRDLIDDSDRERAIIAERDDTPRCRHCGHVRWQNSEVRQGVQS